MLQWVILQSLTIFNDLVPVRTSHIRNQKWQHHMIFQFEGAVNEHLRYFLIDIFDKLVPCETSPAAVSTMWDASSVRGWIEVHSVVILSPPSTALISPCFSGVNVKMKRCYSETRGWRQREERRWWSVSGLSAPVARGENNVRCGSCNLQRWWHC